MNNLIKVELFLYALAAICFACCMLISMCERNLPGTVLYGVCTVIEIVVVIRRFSTIKKNNK